jgi:protocatechuate 3,4-dioxygenase beta subunit
MNPRRLAVGAIVLVLALSAVGWWLLRPSAREDATGPVRPPVARTGEPKEEAAPGPSKSGRAWTLRGTGAVEGILKEYGTERPLGGVKVLLSAGVPGPGKAHEATTLEDGSFLFPKAENFDAWTFTAKTAAPLAELEVAGIEVVESQVTDLGILYATPGFSVPGIVVDEAGAPIPGALVRAVRLRPVGVRSDFLRVIRELPRPLSSVDSATTGPDGRFALKKVPPGSYDLEVSAKGWRTSLEKGVIVHPEAAANEIRIVLAKGHVLKGRVVRATEGPIEGLRIVAFPDVNDERAFLESFVKCLATTDEKGEFTLEGLGAGSWIVGVEVAAEPYHFAVGVDVPREGTLEILIEGDAWLEGTVKDAAEGTPIAGAQVYVVNTRTGTPSAGVATTDAQGRYSIRSLKSGPVMIFMVQAEGYSTWPDDFMSMLRTGSSDLNLKPGRNERDVALGRGGIVRGLVREQGTQVPLEGVRVSVTGLASLFGGSRSGTSDAAGKFEITSVPLGGGVLVASKDGWVQPALTPQGMVGMAMRAIAGGTAGAQDTGEGLAIIISKPGDVVERTIEMAKGTMLRGVVQNPRGEPVSGARVSVEFSTTAGGFMREVVSFIPMAEARLTGGDGTFELAAPVPGQKVVVKAKAQGWLDGRSDPLQVKSGEPVEGVVVRLREGATLQGKVTSSGGKPVDGALVRYVKEEDGNDWGRQWRLQSATPHRTDEAGAFRIVNVEPGRLTVQVSHPSFTSASKSGIEAAEGKAAEVSAELGAALGLSGKVVAPDGKPVAGARIAIEHQGDSPENDPFWSPPENVTTAVDGTFSAGGLVAGKYQVRASADGWADSEPQVVDAGTAGIAMRLAAAFSISGTVRSRQGAVLANVRVRARREGGDEEWDGSGNTNREGRFEIRDLPAGTYEVLVEAGWGAGPSKPNLVPARVKGVNAGTQDLLVEVEEGLRITGTVLRADGTPVPEGWVSANVIAKAGETPARGVNAPLIEGKFELTGLAPGRYRIGIGGGDVPFKQVEADAGTEGLKVQYGQGGGVDGRVLNPDGTAAGGAYVHANGPAGASWAQAGADGKFSLREVPAGTYTVSANKEADGKDYQGITENVAVTTGSNTGGVEVVLQLKE